MIEDLHNENPRLPVIGHLEITRLCNFGCPVCYNDVQKRPEMSTEQIEKIIDDISDAGCIYLNISGGEPFVRRDFLKIYLYAIRRGLKVSLETNAGLLSAHIIETLTRYPPFLINISIYGTQQDVFDATTRRESDYEIVIDNLRKLKNAGVKFRLRTPISVNNYRNLGEMSDLAQDLGVIFKWDPKIWWDQAGKRKNIFRCTSEMIYPLLGTHPIYNEVYSTFKKMETEIREVTHCKWGINEFYINPYGELHYCNVFWTTKYNLLLGSFAEAWAEWYPLLRRTDGDYCTAKHLLPTNGLCPWGYIERNASEDASLSIESRIMNYLTDRDHSGQQSDEAFEEIGMTNAQFAQLRSLSRIQI
jgi:MoaA/NifB/PqqE/SkfB family radical SAM enzyme